MELAHKTLNKPEPKKVPEKKEEAAPDPKADANPEAPKEEAPAANADSEMKE